MKTYLLLRSNKQSGPHSFDELSAMGLRAQDLLWVEGKSASWRYPSEMEEFRAQVSSLPAESYLDIGFSQVQNDLVHYRESEREAEETSSPENISDEFPTLAVFIRENGQGAGEIKIKADSDPLLELPEKAFMPDSAKPLPEKAFMPDSAKPLPGLLSLLLDESATADEEFPTMVLQDKPMVPSIQRPATPPRSKIIVTLPAAVADKTLVLIHPKELKNIASPPAEDIHLVAPVEFPRPVTEDRGSLAQTGMISTKTESILQTDHNPTFYPVSEEQMPRIRRPVIEFLDDNDLSPAVQLTALEPEYRPLPTRDKGVLMQRMAVGAAVVSIVAVGGLIANSVFNPNAYNYTTERVSSEQNVTGSGKADSVPLLKSAGLSANHQEQNPETPKKD